MPLTATVPLTDLVVWARADLLRSGQNIGPGLASTIDRLFRLVTRLKYPPPYRETGVAIPLSHYVSCGIADYCCYTPHFFP